jgi:hypothetical protein
MARERPPRNVNEAPPHFVEDYASRAIAARATQGLPPRVEDSETLELLAQALDSGVRPVRSVKKSA